MHDILRFVLLGLGPGAAYGLGALGMVAIFRGSGVVNLGHGAMALVGVLVYNRLRVDGEWPLVPALLVSLAACAALGVLIHVAIMRTLRQASSLTQMIATLGVLITIEGAAVLRYGSISRLVPSELPTETWTIFGARLGQDRVWLFLIGSALTVLLWAFYRFTRFGVATTAVAENSRNLAALGVSPDKVAAANWAIGSALAGLTGILLVPITGLVIRQFTMLVVVLLAVALVGGLRSFPVTFAGGLAIGIAQSLITRFASDIHYPGTDVRASGLSEAVPFLCIILLLVVRGSSIPERGSAQVRLPTVGSGRPRPIAIAGTLGVVVIGAHAFFSVALIDALIITVASALILLSLVVVTGYAGQLSLMQFSLAGIGALAAARVSSSAELPFVVALIAGMLAATVVGVLVGLPALRTRGVNLAIATFAMAITFQTVIFANEKIGGGQGGINVGRIEVAGISVNALDHPAAYLTVAAIVLTLCSLAVCNLRRGAVGRRLLAVRSNERAAAALGISVTEVKVYAFGLASGLAGLGGVLLAYRNPLVLMAPFDAFNSLQAVSHAVIGGIGYIAGPLFGAPLASGGLGAWIIELFGEFRLTWLYLISGVVLLFVVIGNPNGMFPVNAHVLHAVTGKLSRRRTARRTPASLVMPERGDVEPVEPMSLHADNIRVAFGGVVAVDGVSIQAQPGRVVGLIGPNGAGKTTLLDALSGYVPTGDGSVLLNATPIDGLPIHVRARHGLGRSFQGLELFEDMTVLENLQSGADKRDRGAYLTGLFRARKFAPTSTMAAACDEFGLVEFLDRYPRELPYGKRRAVAIARAIASRPSVLLLDEPAAGLDDEERRELGHLIKRLATEWGMAVVLIEHDVDLVLRVSDHVIALNFGRVIAEGTPREIRRSQAVIDAYLGDHEVHGAPVESAAELVSGSVQ